MNEYEQFQTQAQGMQARAAIDNGAINMGRPHPGQPGLNQTNPAREPSRLQLEMDRLADVITTLNGNMARLYAELGDAHGHLDTVFGFGDVQPGGMMAGEKAPERAIQCTLDNLAAQVDTLSNMVGKQFDTFIKSAGHLKERLKKSL